MRLSGLTAVAAVLVPLTSTLTPAEARAQQPIRILRHAPFDTVRSGRVITISFDRPVAGSVDQAPDAKKLVRLDPPFKAQVQWRDPVTLRIIPNETLRPGRRYHITVRKGLTATDGGRLADAYEFTLRTAGPALVTSNPSLSSFEPATLDPLGRLKLVYSAPVDSATVARIARLELMPSVGCPSEAIRYRVTSQTPLNSVPNFGALFSGDDRERAVAQIVELRPERVPPESCIATVVIPSFDANDRAEIRYQAETAKPFRMSEGLCPKPSCYGGPLTLVFTAPVDRESLLGHIRLQPDDPFTIDGPQQPSNSWSLGLSAKPRTVYRAELDSSVRDVYGRRLAGPNVATYSVGDRPSALGHQLGFFTIPRQRPVLRISHVNIDSVEIAMVAIPDSLRTVAITAPYPDALALIVASVRDTVKLRVHLPAGLNEDRITEVPIPSGLLNASGGAPLIAIRARSLSSVRAVALDPPDTAGVQRISEIRITASSDELTRNVALVQVTDLLAHARVSPLGAAVFVTDMNTGSPIAGASVVTRSVTGQVMAGGTSDRSGVASLTPDSAWRPPPEPVKDVDWNWRYGYVDERGGQPVLVEVTRGKDRSVIPVRNMEPGSYRLGMTRTVDPTFVRAMIYPDRAIYRPGEMMYLSSIVCRGWLGNLQPLEPGDSIRVQVTNEDNEPIHTAVLRLGAFGTAADSFRIAPGIALGLYGIDLAFAGGGGWRSEAGSSIRIAEYRAPQFRTSLDIDSATYVLDDSVPTLIKANYYFGPPMPGATVSWSSLTQPAYGVEIPGLPRSFAVASTWSSDGTRNTSGDEVTGDAVLDQRGMLALKVPALRGTLMAPARLTVAATVADVDRQTVTVERSITVHSSSYYIAARDSVPAWYWKNGSPRTIELLVVRPNGERVRGVPITVAVVRHYSVFERIPNTPDGTWRAKMDTVSRSVLASGDSIVRFRFTPSGDGWFEARFTASDSAERPIVTSIGAYGVPARWASGWGGGTTRLVARLARDTVAPGSSATITFISPFERAEAWVTIEREGILAQRRATVAAGENAIAVEVSDAFIPEATVSLVLVNAVPAWSTDSVDRRIRTASMHLTVDASTKRIVVQLDPGASRYAPGDSARVRIRLRDVRGRPVRGQVNVWAVDESILALTDSTRLSVLDSMYAPRGSAFRFGSSAATLALLGQQFRPPGWIRIRGFASLSNSMTNLSEVVVTGTGVAAVDDALRKDFRSTAFYVASATTNDTGFVAIAAKLPDNLTTYRLIAVAVDSMDRFGDAELPLLVTKPLLARSALPRFLRTGDAFHAGAAVTNQTGGAVSSTVTATGLGATRQDGNKAILLTQKNQSTAEARFDWTTSAQPNDTAIFTFTVAARGRTDAVEAALPVRAPYSPRYHTMSGVVRGTQSIRMFLPKDIDPARSTLTLRVGTLPIPTIQAAYDVFRWYPYECTEQLTSNGRAVLAMMRLQNAGLLDSLTSPTAAELRTRLQSIVDLLSRRQTSDGGIGYWSSSGWTTPSLTSEAGRFLLDARRSGADVRQAIVHKATDYVTRYLNAYDGLPDSTYGSRAERSVRAASRLGYQLAGVQFLRHAGVPDTLHENELIELQRWMIWQDRVWLAELLAAREDKSVARRQLQSVWKDVEVAGNRVDLPDSLLASYDFTSNVRPAARLLMATLAIDSMHPLFANLIARVVQQSNAHRRWDWNTQDYGAAAEAMARLISWRGAKTNGVDTVVVQSARGRSGTTLTSTTGRLNTATISLDGLTERDGDRVVMPLQISGGQAMTFFVLTVNEVPRTPPVSPDAKGITVERWYERFDDGRPATQVKEGELVRVRLRVTVPADREFVAVDDPLPAGLEVVDLSLRTSATLQPFESDESRAAEHAGDDANADEWSMRYGRWWGSWWSPWEHSEQRDDRVVYFARRLWKGSYTAQYVARATTAGTFIRPPAHAEEMYNQSLGGRSDGGVFRVLRK